MRAANFPVLIPAFTAQVSVASSPVPYYTILPSSCPDLPILVFILSGQPSPSHSITDRQTDRQN